MANVLLGHWWKLYTSPSPREVALESFIARMGVPYRFQHPVFSAKAIIDFAWPNLMLGLEIDGREHFTKLGREKDALRTERLGKLGWVLLRTTNGEVDLDPAAALIKALSAVQDVLPVHLINQP